jgi:hypothetical protein
MCVSLAMFRVLGVRICIPADPYLILSHPANYTLTPEELLAERVYESLRP